MHPSTKPLKIAIDARLYGLKHAGIGRYVENLITHLSQLDKQNHYTIISNFDTQILNLPQNSEVIKTQVRHYSLAEQVKMARLVNGLDIDLLHVPHFNISLFYQKPLVVTIHDLLWHDKIGFNVTTLSTPEYLIKYLGYRVVVRRAIAQARHVITPANIVKQAIQQRFNKHYSQVSVTYEAASEVFSNPPTRNLDLVKLEVKKPFLVYTGSLYPHKNVISAVKALKNIPGLILVVVSARNVFADRFLTEVETLGLANRVVMMGFVEDSQLRALYTQALALIQPSQSEGFGLTGLESMAAGLPVICSQDSVMAEVYGKAALFVDTNNPDKIAEIVSKLLSNENLRARYIKAGQAQAKKYSWSLMAQQTLDIYQKVAR